MQLINLFEYAGNNSALAVNAETGVIEGVKILGADSANGNRYTPAAMSRAVSLYEGAKVNLDHPPKGQESAPRSYRDRIGVLVNVRVQGDSLYGDLKYNSKHPIAEQLAWDASNNPRNVGLSHNALGKGRKSGGRFLVEEITSVRSVDLVADPATSKGLFEAEENEMDYSALTVELLREHRADLIEALTPEPPKNPELEAEVKKLREQLDRFEAKEKLAAQKSEVEALLVEAKLPEVLITDVLRESLLSADEEGRKKIIDERKTLAEGIKAVKPQSSEAVATKGSRGGKEFAAFIR